MERLPKQNSLFMKRADLVLSTIAFVAQHETCTGFVLQSRPLTDGGHSLSVTCKSCSQLLIQRVDARELAAILDSMLPIEDSSSENN